MAGEQHGCGMGMCESAFKGIVSVLACQRSGTPRKLQNNRSLAQDLNTSSSKYEATLGLVRVKRASSMNKCAFNVTT
jgi:hypothetical protein